MGKLAVVWRMLLAIIARRHSKNDERRRILVACASDYEGCSEGDNGDVSVRAAEVQ
jgi:hypothetical protein